MSSIDIGGAARMSVGRGRTSGPRPPGDAQEVPWPPTGFSVYGEQAVGEDGPERGGDAGDVGDRGARGGGPDPGLGDGKGRGPVRGPRPAEDRGGVRLMRPRPVGVPRDPVGAQYNPPRAQPIRGPSRWESKMECDDAGPCSPYVPATGGGHAPGRDVVSILRAVPRSPDVRRSVRTGPAARAGRPASRPSHAKEVPMARTIRRRPGGKDPI
jgi:hypothetical protein